MAMSDGDAAARAQHLLRINAGDQHRFARIKQYVDGSPALTWMSRGAPPEIQALARISKVNMMPFVIDSEVHSLFLEDFIIPGNPEGSSRVWEAWKRNRFNAYQLAIHRTTVAYGLGYVAVTRGDPVPVMRVVSPRYMYPGYGDDPHWPAYALEDMRDGSWRLYDDTEVIVLVRNRETQSFEVQSRSLHGQGVCPIIRYQPKLDMDSSLSGVVEPLFDFQDQINVTTFLLNVAQHFGAHGQKYIIGWLMENPRERAKLSASSLLSIPKSPGEVEVGQFNPTQLSPYIESRTDTIKLMATVSGTSPAEMLGNMVNLAAETIEAANAAQTRKIGERKMVLGESHEQMLGLVGTGLGVEESPFSRAIWRDANSTISNLERTANALAVIAERLGVPAEELWHMLPGVDRESLTRWRGEVEETGTTGEIESPDDGIEETEELDSE